MLQRVYVWAFKTKKELADYIALLEEAKKRDNRKLGKELKLFMISPRIPPTSSTKYGMQLFITGRNTNI